jgi:hypothetical protein
MRKLSERWCHCLSFTATVQYLRKCQGGTIGKQLQSDRISAELPLGEKASGQKNVECRPQGLTTSVMLNPGLILAAANLT